MTVEYAYLGGHFTEEASSLPAIPRGKATKGCIAVLVDVQGNASASTANELRSTIVGAFYKDPSGSLTSTLRRILQDVNESVYDENERSIRTDRTYATIACAVIRDDDVYIALAGPALCYSLSKTACERLGRAQSQNGERSVERIGQVSDIGVDLYHRSAASLSSLILASVGIADIGDGEFERSIAARPDEAVSTLRALGEKHHGPRAFRSLAVALGPIEPAAPIPVRQKIKQRPTFVTNEITVNTEPPAPMPVWPRIKQRPINLPDEVDVAIDEPRSSVDVRPARRFVDVRPPRRVAMPGVDIVEPSYRQTQQRSDRPPPRKPEPRKPDYPAAEELIKPPGRVAPGRPTMNGRADKAPSPAVPPPRPSPAPMNDAIADARRVMLGLTAQSGQLLRNPPRIPAGVGRVAMLVAVVVAFFAVGYVVATFAVPIAKGGADYASAIAKLSQAEQRERDGLAATDPLVRRSRLNEAAQIAATALQERPSLTTAATTAARIQKEIEAASGATPMAAPQKVLELPSPSDQLVIAGNDVAVLDRTNSRVYLYMLNVDGTAAQARDNAVLVRRGDHVGPVTIGDITSIAWMPAGGSRATPAWIMLDRSGYLVQYVSTDGLSLLALADPGSWGDATAIKGYGGNLFVLNAKKGAIAWYGPQPTGFDGTANSYLSSTDGVNLTDAVGLAVQNDVYVTHATGRIDRFVDGKSVAIPALPPDLAPTPPAGLAVGSASVFVGDPQHGRIVQLSRDGHFQRALRADDSTQLTAMRDLSVSGDGKFLYVLSGSSLLRYAIPETP